jgi:hypothetical protein
LVSEAFTTDKPSSINLPSAFTVSSYWKEMVTPVLVGTLQPVM